MKLVDPLARVRGLGSAKDGTGHWWMQRVTAVALVPLLLWFVFSLTTLDLQSHAAVQAWAGRPINAALLVLMLVAVFHHGLLGIQVVVEDYIHNRPLEVALLLGAKFAAIFCSVIGVLAVARLALGS